MGKINWTNPRGLSRDDLIAAAEEKASRLARYGTTTEEDLAAIQASETGPGDISLTMKSPHGYHVFSARDMQMNPERYGGLDQGALARGNPDGYYITDESGNLKFVGPFRTIEPPRSQKGLRAARQSIRR